jgi:hypothetical protein
MTGDHLALGGDQHWHGPTELAMLAAILATWSGACVLAFLA